MQHVARYDGSGEAAAPVKRTPPLSRAIIALDRAIYAVARHWLFATNGIFFLYAAGLFVAPALRAAGYAGLAQPIYDVNRLFCHQRPDRSFYVFGQQMATCQRCTAIYVALLAAGLVYAAARRHVPPPRLMGIVLLTAPMAVDGFGELFGQWESTAASRVLTGSLFGVAVCWGLLPWLEIGFARMRAQIEALFARLVAEGRARPL